MMGPRKDKVMNKLIYISLLLMSPNVIAQELPSYEVKTSASVIYGDGASAIIAKEGRLDIEGFICNVTNNPSGVDFSCFTGKGFINITSKCDVHTPGSINYSSINLFTGKNVDNEATTVIIKCETSYTRLLTKKK